MPIPLIRKEEPKPPPDAWERLFKRLDDYETKKAQDSLDNDITFGPVDEGTVILWFFIHSRAIFWTAHILATIIFFPLLIITIPLHIGFNNLFGEVADETRGIKRDFKKLTEEINELKKSGDNMEIEDIFKEAAREQAAYEKKQRNNPNRYDYDYEDPYVFNPDTLKFEIRKKK